MKVLQVSAVCMVVWWAGGCSDPPPPKKTVFDPLTQQLDRARDVQNTVDQNTDATAKAVDAQEHGDAQRGENQDSAEGHP